MRDSITHDDQDNVWPKYIALNSRLLDKLELVLAELESQQGIAGTQQLELDVHSGFRTPSHNRHVQRATRDSRHQYGDVAAVVMDAQCKGSIYLLDSRMG